MDVRGCRGSSKRTRIEEDTTSSKSKYRESSSEREAEAEAKARTVRGKRKAPKTLRKKKGASYPPRRCTCGPVIREQGSSERERWSKHAAEAQSVDAQ